MSIPIICLMGPTASGKTQLALKLYQHFPIEIISVDSAMVYRDMDIGTAKPSKEILQSIPHHLINICDPNQPYSVAQFKEDAENAIHAIIQRGKIPLLVGGTMLYFHVFKEGIAALPDVDLNIRERLLIEGETLGWPLMHERLKKIDAKTAARIHPHDKQRIQRALEVYEVSGKCLSDWFDSQNKLSSPFKILNIMLTVYDRSKLHMQIQNRFLEMLKNGFIDEVKYLIDKYQLHLGFPSMRALGYRQVLMYLNQALTYEEMCQQGIIATRQFSKRQFTWLKKWQNAVIFESEDPHLLEKTFKTLHSFVHL